MSMDPFPVSGDLLGTLPHCPGSPWGLGPSVRGPLPTAQGLSQCPGTPWGPLPTVWGPCPIAQGPLPTAWGPCPTAQGPPRPPPGPPGWGSQHRSGAQSRGGSSVPTGWSSLGSASPSCYPAQPLRSLWGVPPGTLGCSPHPTGSAHPAVTPPEVSYNFLIKAFDIPALPLSGGGSQGGCSKSRFIVEPQDGLCRCWGVPAGSGRGLAGFWGCHQ